MLFSTCSVGGFQWNLLSPHLLKKTTNSSGFHQWSRLSHHSKLKLLRHCSLWFHHCKGTLEKLLLAHLHVCWDGCAVQLMPLPSIHNAFIQIRVGGGRARARFLTAFVHAYRQQGWQQWRGRPLPATPLPTLPLPHTLFLPAAAVAGDAGNA